MQWNMDHSRHNIENVAAGYDALPTYDPKAKSAWKTLADESKSHADFIRKHLNVSETDNPEPYNSSEQMINDIRNNRNFSVSTANSEHPIWTPEENVNFRIVHDVFGHGATEGNFGWHGENDACSTHFGLSSPEARKALATECLGQTGYAINRGNFTDQKVGFIPELHEGLTEANKDAPVPTREQLMQRVLKGPEKTSKWKIAFKKTAVGEQQDFFGQAARGEHAPLKPLQETYTPQQQSLLNTFNKHKGYFDEHIETSIPNFRKNSLGKMNAIVQSHPQNAKMLDIASSEGSLGKTITEASGGRIQTTNLDPQEQMIKTFNTKSQVPGAESISAAFGTSFEDEKGQTVPKFAPSHSYDVVHESMAFQFFGPEREEHIVEAKRLLAPDGIFLSEEKVRTDNETENETQKDIWKAQYHTPEALQKKQKQVGFQGENTGGGGMMDKMVHQDILESLLKKYFKYVVQYWSSGNFKGYAASDSKDKIDAYINNYEFEPHVFETEQIPRSIDNPKISKWKIASVIKNLTPEYLNWIKKKVKYEGWMRGADQMYLNMAIPDEYDVSVEKERREQMQDPSFTIRQKEINPENDIKFIGLVGLLHSLAMIPIEQIDLNQLNEENLEYNPQDIQEIINAYSHGFWKGAINIENKMKQNPFLTRDDLGLEYKNNPHPWPGGEYKMSTYGQRALAIGDSAVETTFNAVPEVHDPSEDEEIQIVNGKKKKWKMVRPKDHKGEDASYAGPENKSGWGFYSHFNIDALIAQYETKLGKWHKIGAAPLDSNKEYEIPMGHSVVQELKDHFAPIGLIPITSYGDSRRFPLTEQPAFDKFRNHRIDLYDPEHKEKVYGINYQLNHPDKYQHRDKYGQLADPEDRYPTYVDSIHFYDTPSQDFPDSPNEFYLSEIDEKGNSRPEEPPTTWEGSPPALSDYHSYENRYNEIQERHPHAAKRMLSWMAKNLPRPFGANIVNPKLKEKALKHNYVESKWKLSVPPADQAKEFSEGFEQTKTPEELKHKYPVRGHRWELDAKKLERLYNHPQWPLETPYYVQALSKEDIGRPRGVNSMDEWSSLMGEHHSPGEIKAGLKSGAIFINPLLSPEAANEALWHELQHAYQHQEKRWQEHKNDYVNPLELQNRGLSDEEKKEKTKQYYKHPMELDANEFADYMKKHPLISESEPHYNPNWVPEEQRHAAQELIDQYYAEHGSKHRLRLPSLKNSKWKIAGETRTKLLERAAQLPEDSSKIIHQFDNGWTIRGLKTVGDHYREGQLMGNCVSNNVADHIDWDYLTNEYDQWLTPEEIEECENDGTTAEEMLEEIFLTDPSKYEKIIKEYAKDYRQEPAWKSVKYHSLRDENNLPHVSFGGGYALGRHNSEIKDEYKKYLDFFPKESSVMKEAPARSKAQFRYMQGICNGSIEPPENMTRAQACEYVKGQHDYKDLPDKNSKWKKRSWNEWVQNEIAKGKPLYHGTSLELREDILKNGLRMNLPTDRGYDEADWDVDLVPNQPRFWWGQLLPGFEKGVYATIDPDEAFAFAGEGQGDIWQIDPTDLKINYKGDDEHGAVVIQQDIPPDKIKLVSKQSKWKKISIGLWDPENTDSSHYFETKVVEEIPISVAMQMLDVERGKEDYESSNIENLVKNISQSGFLNPIIIDYNINDNTAFISEGNHRVQAAKQLGIEWIPARGVRNYGQKSRFKELPVQWQGTQEDHEGNFYIPPNFPPHMIGIPVKEKVKGFEDGENYNGWETKEARQKDKPTPAQKLAKKKELQDKLIDCGFSLKAASSIALQEISQKYSYWVDGYNAAVGMRDPETGQWHMDVGFDPKLTHGAVTSDYINDLGTPSMRSMIKDKESRTDYYHNHTARGLYNPKTKDFIHFSYPDQYDFSVYGKQIEKFWRDLAEQNGIVVDTLRILNDQSGHFEDINVSDLEMPEEIREQMAKKNLTLKTLDERVDRVRELEAEGLSSSEALNKMTLEEWELKYKKEFERGGKYVYASKWKIVAKGYVTKRSNFINHRRVGFIPGKMIHHKHYSDLKGHQKAVQHYGPLKTHNVRNFKKESVLNEDQAQELFGQQPYMYHDVAAARTKKGNNSQIPIINSIFKNGILPKEQTGVSEYDDWLTSRPEHVYLGEERFYPKNAVPALRIDMSKVDPSTLAPDEDLFPVYGYNNQHAHRLDFNDIKSPPFEKEHSEGATLGNWAHEHSHLDTPKNVRASKELMGSISVNGGVPADASHFNPPWLDKVEFDIRENMEDPESDLEDDRHLMDLILSNQERISEDGDSDYLSRMMDLYNELYEEVQRRKQMYKRQSKWKIAKPNLVPSEGVRSAARRGIKYHAEGKAGDGFEAATLDRAHKIANGEELTPEHVKRMHSFFERHAGGRSQKAKKGEITPWDVAWLAWGGTAGRSWAASKVRELENSEKTSKKKCECWEGYKRVPGTKPCEPGSCEKCDKAHKQSKWKIADHQGWTNYETWNVNAMMLNDYELNKHFHNLVVNKASGNQFIADAIGLVIGPHNKQLQEDFSSMSDDEEVEMQKQNQEEDWWRNAEKQHPDDYLAQEAYVRQMKEITMTFMGEPQPTDIADYWIDESKVNWKEIYNYWKSNAEAEGNQIISKWKIC